MRWSFRRNASHALAALLLAPIGCTLSADLDSLTSGGGTTPNESGDGGRQPDSGPDCSPNTCIQTEGSPSGQAEDESDDTNSTSDTGRPNVTRPNTSDTNGAEATSEAEATSSSGPSSLGPTPFGTDPVSTSEPNDSEVDDTDGDDIDSDDTDDDDTNAQTSSAPTATAPGDSTGTTSSSGPTDDTDGTANLIHRYQFTDVATAIVDEVGDADGSVVGTATQGDGRLVFDGATYVELPTNTLSGRENVTLEVWFTSYQTRSWERIFDIGQSSEGDGESYLFLTPQSTASNRTMRVTFRADGEAEVTVDSVLATADNLETHVAVVFDGSENEIRFYHNGELSAFGTTEGSLQDVDVANVWLGRSLFDGDPLLEGDINELRIYDGTLGADYVRQSFEAGPDVLVP